MMWNSNRDKKQDKPNEDTTTPPPPHVDDAIDSFPTHPDSSSGNKNAPAPAPDGIRRRKNKDDIELMMDKVDINHNGVFDREEVRAVAEELLDKQQQT